MTPRRDLAMLLTPQRLARLLGVAVSQTGVQAIGFLAAIVLVREMQPEQYGWFTIAASMITLAAVLGDLGLSSAVLAVGGRLGATFAAVMAVLRETRAAQLGLAMIALAITAVAGGAMLLRQSMPVPEVLVLGLLVAATALCQMRVALDLAAARLLGSVAATQKLELASNALRLALVAAAAAWWQVGATLACAIGLVASLACHLALRRHLLTLAPGLGPGDPAQAPADLPQPAMRQAVFAQLRQQAPNALYFLFSSQVALWLVGLFGSAERVAEVGALSRLAAVFAIVGTVVAALVLPYFARHREADTFAKGLRAVNLFFALALVALVFAAWAWPRPMLWLLGGHYGALHEELAWMLVATTLSAWGGVLYSIGCARGWVMPFWLSAPAGALAIAIAALVVDAGSVRGSFVINTGSAATGLLCCLGYLAWRMRQLRALGEPMTLPGPAPRATP